MNKKRILSLVAATMLSVAVLAGCGSKEEGMKDGKYAVESKADDKGYVSSLAIEVKDGKIISADFDMTNDKGSKKDDEGYNTAYKAKSGIDSATAFKTLGEKLVEKQAADIDAVTGATGTTETFKKLAAKAIENANAGTTDKTVVE